MKPRLRTFSFSSGEMPPGRVLKAWMSQGSLEKAGSWRILRPRDARVSSAEDEGERLRAARFGGRDTVFGMRR